MKIQQITKVAAALALLVPGLSMAESSFVQGSSANLTSSASLNFTITVPRMLYFAVGQSSVMATNPALSTVSFDYSGSAESLGRGASFGPPVPPSGVQIQLKANDGQVSLSTASATVLTHGTDATLTIPWSTITTTTANAGLTPPSIPNSGTNPSTASPTPTGSNNKVTEYDTTWSYSFSNPQIYAAGVYTGKVTYTVVMP